jgi:glycine cleavage system H protein
MTPSDRVYTDTHEWVKIEGDIATIGISDYAQKALGDITFVELPEKDSPIEHGHECGVIESVKAASDLIAPIDGHVIEVNEELDGSPELINEDPYEAGWIFKLNNIDKEQTENLMDAAEYESTHDDDH